jgi:hypothetical protein
MRRALTLLLAGALLSACGASSKPSRPSLPSGSDIYTLRHNPTHCLVDRPSLQAEVQTPQGWERVALEDVDEDADAVARLLKRWADEPYVEVRLAGRLGVDTRTYLGNHVARVLRVAELDPPEDEGE